MTRPSSRPPRTVLRDVDENTAPGEDIGEPVAATDPEDNDPLTYSLDVDGAASFDINKATTGQLRTKAALDHETTTANYSVTVTATDTGRRHRRHYRSPSTVNNLDEPGTVTLNRRCSPSSLSGTPLEARLADLDGGSVRHQLVVGAFSEPAPPLGPSSMGKPQPPIRRMPAMWATTCGPLPPTMMEKGAARAPRRSPPTRWRWRWEGTRRSLRRARPRRAASRGTRPRGRKIGAPVSATDADNDVLTYSLGGRDAVRFALDASSGQLSTEVPADRVFDTSYTVFVSVSDSKDDDGNPEADPQIDATTEVTINVTTVTVTTPSSGGSGGGSRRRPDSNPNPNADSKPNPNGDTNANRTAVLRRDRRGAQRDRNGGS